MRPSSVATCNSAAPICECRLGNTASVSNNPPEITADSSGRREVFPEVDRAEWFALPLARLKILASQLILLNGLDELNESSSDPA